METSEGSGLSAEGGVRRDEEEESPLPPPPPPPAPLLYSACLDI